MISCTLQSGSNGNCFYVETSDARLLFDAGISGKAAQQRMAQHQRDIKQVDALIISHNHMDHVSGAGVFHRKFNLPVYMTANAWKICQSACGPIGDLHLIQPGATLTFGSTVVHTICTPHDAKDSLAFIIEDKHKKLGIFTDLGHRFDGLDTAIEKLDGLYLESNYDPEMLAGGEYPPWLKKRIAGDHGHLSNHQAAQLVRETNDQLQFLVLSHLSQNNNHPDLALATAKEILPHQPNISLASRTNAGKLHILK